MIEDARRENDVARNGDLVIGSYVKHIAFPFDRLHRAVLNHGTVLFGMPAHPLQKIAAGNSFRKSRHVMGFGDHQRPPVLCVKHSHAAQKPGEIQRSRQTCGASTDDNAILDIWPNAQVSGRPKNRQAEQPFLGSRSPAFAGSRRRTRLANAPILQARPAHFVAVQVRTAFP